MTNHQLMTSKTTTKKKHKTTNKPKNKSQPKKPKVPLVDDVNEPEITEDDIRFVEEMDVSFLNALKM